MDSHHNDGHSDAHRDDYGCDDSGDNHVMIVMMII